MIYMASQEPQIVKSIFKNNKTGGITLPNFKHITKLW